MKTTTSFKKLLTNTILQNADIGHLYQKMHPNSKYKLDDILEEIIYVLKTGISWRNLRSIIPWKSIYFHFQRFVKNGIFKSLYLLLRNKYFANNKTHVQIIDSTFIANKCGKDQIARNSFFKNKNCNKISLLTDEKGVPLSVLTNSGNVHDNSFISKHVDDICAINKQYNKKVILLADKAYEGKNIRANLKPFNYSLMIPKKKNSKTSYKFNKKLYKKRIRVEHTFQKLKVFRRIYARYDSYIATYLEFIFLAVSLIIFKEFG
jgi:transposase